MSRMLLVTALLMVGLVIYRVVYWHWLVKRKSADELPAEQGADSVPDNEKPLAELETEKEPPEVFLPVLALFAGSDQLWTALWQYSLLALVTLVISYFIRPRQSREYDWMSGYLLCGSVVLAVFIHIVILFFSADVDAGSVLAEGTALQDAVVGAESSGISYWWIAVAFVLIQLLGAKKGVPEDYIFLAAVIYPVLPFFTPLFWLGSVYSFSALAVNSWLIRKKDQNGVAVFFSFVLYLVVTLTGIILSYLINLVTGWLG